MPSSPAYESSQPRELSRGNWRQQPQSRWAFRHVDALLPCATVANDPARVRELDVRSNATAGFFLRRVLLPVTSTDGFVVLAHGEIVCEHYANGSGPHTRHILMSASKSFVGLLAELLQREGRLDLDRPAAHFVP
jgi:CubicO group peptidase (beta-lactamase class C family)